MAAIDTTSLTAGDLMSRDVATIPADLPLAEAARFLARRGLHGAPVVGPDGRCVGVLSVTDVARWAAGRHPGPRRPLTCGFLDRYQEPGGHEAYLCRLAGGVCPFQRMKELPDGRLAVACSEPHCVPVDWQVVALEAAPGEHVRDAMSTELVTADPATQVADLARLMLDRGVHRVVVLDADRRPVGVTAVADLLQVLAHPELTPAGGAA